MRIEKVTRNGEMSAVKDLIIGGRETRLEVDMVVEEEMIDNTNKDQEDQLAQ